MDQAYLIAFALIIAQAVSLMAGVLVYGLVKRRSPKAMRVPLSLTCAIGAIPTAFFLSKAIYEPNPYGLLVLASVGISTLHFGVYHLQKHLRD